MVQLVFGAVRFTLNYVEQYAELAWDGCTPIAWPADTRSLDLTMHYAKENGFVVVLAD